MSYCLNPACAQPQNSDTAIACQTCGSDLLLCDRYRPLRPIAQGGFGRTFLGRDQGQPDTPLCVIKQFLPDSPNQSSRAEGERLFRQEAERLQQLGQHPQIPALLDFVERQDGQYLIQAWIAGQTLEQQLEASGAWTEAQVRSLLNQLLPVLQFIHQAQVIHRDIKPSNIIYPASGKLPVLVDFGASKVATRCHLSAFTDSDASL